MKRTSTLDEFATSVSDDLAIWLVYTSTSSGKSLLKSSETGLGETVTRGQCSCPGQRVVEAAATNTTAGRKRKYTPEQLAKITKYAVHGGSMAATSHLSEKFLYTLGESTVSLQKAVVL